MRMLLIGHDAMALESEKTVFQNINSDVEVNTFTDMEQAYLFMKGHPTDAVFVHFGRNVMEKMAFTKKIRQISNSIYICWVCPDGSYAMEAFEMRVNGYLVEPVLEEDFREEFADAKMMIEWEMKNYEFS